MRSRYSAFALGDEAWLRASWDPATCPRRIHLDPDRSWVRLEGLATSDGGPLDADGTVTFRAHHARSGEAGVVEAGVVEERSRFTRVDGRWVYVGPA